jgi:hypothetical protein
LGNKFHLQELYMCLTSPRLQGYRGQEIRSLLHLSLHNLVQFNQGFKVDYQMLYQMQI